MPSSCFFPGSVTSSFSAASFAFLSLVFMSACADSRSCVIFSLTSFASCPITGRSSGESLPICFRIAVSSPFFPRYFTRRASSSCFELALASSSCACCLIFSSCSFILFTSKKFMLRALPLKPTRDAVPRPCKPLKRLERNF